MAGIGWTQPQNLKYLFLKTYHRLASNPGGFRRAHSNTIHHRWLEGGHGAAGVREPAVSCGPSPPSLTLHLLLLPPSHPQGFPLGARWGFSSSFSLLKLCKAWGTHRRESLCWGENSGSYRHMKQVARTSAASPHAPHPKPLLPTAATAKAILFFCFHT